MGRSASPSPTHAGREVTLCSPAASQKYAAGTVEGGSSDGGSDSRGEKTGMFTEMQMGVEGDGASYAAKDRGRSPARHPRRPASHVAGGLPAALAERDRKLQEAADHGADKVRDTHTASLRRSRHQGPCCMPHRPLAAR